MTDATATTTPRWRLIVFRILLAVLLVLHLGERPQMLTFIVTAFGDVGDLASHEVHLFAQGVFGWAMLAAIAANLRRPARKVGAAWVYGLGTVLAFGLLAIFADLPAGTLPVIAAAIVIAVLAFLAHPSSLRAKVTPVQRPSATLLALGAVAAVPLVVYTAGQIGVHLGSGPSDEHYEFGHWIVMAAVGVIPGALAIVAAAKVSGWRFPLWTAGLMVASLGVASLGINAVSQLSTLWALLAIVWGAAFIAVGEVEARRETGVAASASRPARAPV